MSIKISLKFVPTGPINNIPALVQIMAWRRRGDKPLSEPMVLPTHSCVTRPQWVNSVAPERYMRTHFFRIIHLRFTWVKIKWIGRLSFRNEIRPPKIWIILWNMVNMSMSFTKNENHYPKVIHHAEVKWASWRRGITDNSTLCLTAGSGL